MNNTLELKGKRFVQAKRNSSFGGPSMNSKKNVDVDHINMLIADLKRVKNYWQTRKRPFKNILISVFYNKIVAKSNRISGLFKGEDPNYSIVGAKFNNEKDKHIITYCIVESELGYSIDLLNSVHSILIDRFNGKITKAEFESKVCINNIPFKAYGISSTRFKKVVADISYIEHFNVNEAINSDIQQSIVTLYKTDTPIKEVLKDIGIDVMESKLLDEQTVFLNIDEIKTLYENAPYLIAMSTVNMNDYSLSDFENKETENIMFLSSPTTEPTIGVIDTLFDERVYFSNWVEYHDCVDKEIPRNQDDYRHGTAISSIIVDGPRLNPWLDDGCGHFKVRHFGVAAGKKFSSFSVIKAIKKIIRENKDIKVWNLSLGSDKEINDNFISAEASVLDQIQYENDVIFVIAGTNKTKRDVVKIGSPADSINSMVVNSVTKSGKSVEYARKGLALSFFAKPDISYYGGSTEQFIYVCEPLGCASVAGTSYAAPWISRKLSYLIDVLGMSREAAKALIIDSAKGWNDSPKPEEVAVYGHGIVPIKITDIIHTPENEIKFIVTDVSEKWNTYNYNFPVPLKNDKYPYQVRATMCYFPKCDRTKGVDYTNTELNLHFGPINDLDKIHEVNDDRQNKDNESPDDHNFVLEGNARSNFRKWDNVKYLKSGPGAKKSYTNKNWGIEVKTVNRLDPKDGEGIRFGIVVTLKEIHGINRIDEFIKSCILSGWLVNQIDVTNRIDIYQKLNEEIELG